MFFRKKKEDLSDQLAVYQERKDPRYVLTAGISLEGFDGEGLMQDVSNSGCRLESSTFVSIIPDQVYKVTITPDSKDGIGPFSLKLKLNWTRSSEALFQAGFSLEEDQSNTQLKRYAELLHARGVKPDYGNKSMKR
jgi:hypothetical protein